MDDVDWHQLNISYPGHSAEEREQHAVAHLDRALAAAETAGLLTDWWFIRKDAWRIRYRPTATHRSNNPARHLLTDNVTWTTDIYEPEVHAFGGTHAMAAAHLLFHRDSRHILAYLEQQPRDRREQSLILCTQLMRAAALDRNEQGDVWAQVLDHRTHHGGQPSNADADTWDRFTSDTRRLLTGRPHTTTSWHNAFTDAGTTLRQLRTTGKLTRGLRAVIALHVIFHWNRLGLPARTQATLARAAKDAIFGSTPAPPDQQPSSAKHEAAPSPACRPR